MKNSMQTQQGQAGVIFTPGSAQPKGLFHALAEIEQWSFTERTAGDIDPQVVTTPVFFSFMSVGWHSAAIAFLVAFLTLPFSYGVFHGAVPIFGSYNPDAFDIFIAFSISLAPTLVKSIFMAVLLGRCYMGSTTKRAIKALVWEGMVLAKWLFTFFGFVIYHLLYYKLLTPRNIDLLAENISSTFEFIPYDWLYRQLMIFRHNLIPSAWILLGVVVLQTLILVASYLYSERKTRTIKTWREKWVPVREISA